MGLLDRSSAPHIRGGYPCCFGVGGRVPHRPGPVSAALLRRGPCVPGPDHVGIRACQQLPPPPPRGWWAGAAVCGCGLRVLCSVRVELCADILPVPLLAWPPLQPHSDRVIFSPPPRDYSKREREQWAGCPRSWPRLTLSSARPALATTEMTDAEVDDVAAELVYLTGPPPTQGPRVPFVCPNVHSVSNMWGPAGTCPVPAACGRVLAGAGAVRWPGGSPAP